ncbi:hypothetical protein BJ982_000809 [Sphaerisporangium siamense]|uniref:Uncharacterized protein n=1 Tax=Sphaerisporangium siamense TaxID=795645 RepID=A0A7W7G895_9ACTN|nr:hypothetical protein [Sphaerisporangium siamense]
MGNISPPQCAVPCRAAVHDRPGAARAPRLALRLTGGGR